VVDLWVRHNSVRVHFDSLQQLQTLMQQGIDSSLYVPVTAGSQSTT